MNVVRPVMVFDLNAPVGDVAWAPYSSTVFANVTTAGRVRVFDLSINKHEEVGWTRRNKKCKLTHIAFNPKSPVICVGDDRGTINLLKLSSPLQYHQPTVTPNLASSNSTTGSTNNLAAVQTTLDLSHIDRDFEIEKLEKLMIIPDRDPSISYVTPKEDKDKAKKGGQAKGSSSQQSSNAATSSKPGTAGHPPATPGTTAPRPASAKPVHDAAKDDEEEKTDDAE